jgi:8-oxo-dGTP pyrophosphatase MutT (NUDIX family)
MMKTVDVDLDYLRGLIAHARDPCPHGWQPWFLRGFDQPLGLLSPERLALLVPAMPSHMPLVRTGGCWVWYADTFSATERSLALQAIAQDLYEGGQLRGWRNESFACWGWIDEAWPYARAELFRLERASFRFFGLRSHAAHVHGITPDGRIWCGRRSLDKPTDPGLLDNLAAGGLPAGEEPVRCAVREILEEAGLERTANDLRGTVGEVITERAEPEGWHSERLFVYSVQVGAHEHPKNRDGEVSEFLCLDMPEVLQRMRAGEFTRDAACSIAMALVGKQVVNLG